MDTWQRGSFRSSGFFKRLSLRRNKKLGSQVIILNQNSQTLDSNGQCHKRELLRDLTGKSNYLSCQSEQNLATKMQPPPKPPRLYLDSASCPNITDHTDSPSAENSFSSTSHHSHKATQTQPDLFCKNQDMDWCHSERIPWHGTTDPFDPFFSFQLDLGPSLLEDILQTLKSQNLLLNVPECKEYTCTLEPFQSLEQVRMKRGWLQLNEEFTGLFEHHLHHLSYVHLKTKAVA